MKLVRLAALVASLAVVVALVGVGLPEGAAERTVTSQPTRSITVSGSGSVQVGARTGRGLSFGVTTQGEDRRRGARRERPRDARSDRRADARRDRGRRHPDRVGLAVPTHRRRRQRSSATRRRTPSPRRSATWAARGR